MSVKITVTLWEALKLWWYGVLMEHRFNHFNEMGRTRMWQEIRKEKVIPEATYDAYRAKFSNSVHKYWTYLEGLDKRS